MLAVIPGTYPYRKLSGIFLVNTVYDLFTKFTFLFTILIIPSEKYQDKFVESILKDKKK